MRLGRSIAICALSMLCAAAAHADIYGFVDASGETHLATERVDDRYLLFMKGDAVGRENVDDAGGRTTPDIALMKSRLFQRLVAHPNIAKYDAAIRRASARQGLDPTLVKAVIAVESGFEPAAVSQKGAIGLMQVMPATGERYGVRADRKRTVEAKLLDPAINLDIGTRYLADLRRQFGARPELALAAYNAGENSVIRYRNEIPPFPETRTYVKLVEQFRAFYAPPVRTRSRELQDRIRVTMPARRNLPDPTMAPRLPAPPEVAVVVPPASAP